MNNVRKSVPSEINAKWNMSLNERFKVLSLFTGIGGLDMGFGEQVIVHKDSIIEKDFIDKNYDIDGFVELKVRNFNVVFRNDILKGAKQVFDLNSNGEKNYVIKSIFDLVREDYNFPLVDVVLTGFPCQDFSHCGKRLGFGSEVSHNSKDKIVDNENNRGNLYKCSIDVIRKSRPKIFVAENVYGLLTMKSEPIKVIIRQFEELGYTVEYQLIYCKDFGIPQKRVRVIIIGISNDRKVNSLSPDWNNLTKNKVNCNIGKYFEHLEEPGETDDISQQLFSKAKKLFKKSQGQEEIDLKSYAPTQRAQGHGNFAFRRYEKSVLNKEESHLPQRRVTLREAGLIQTFPPRYKFVNETRKNMNSYVYIGNAVPPLLGYLVADKVEELLNHYFA